MSLRLTVSEALRSRAGVLLEQLLEHRFASRLFAKDTTLWGERAVEEASQRLSWVDPFEHSKQILEDAVALREQLRASAIDQVLLCGMGGSSLGPEVIAHECEAPLSVLDSTHPDEVRRALDRDLSKTVVVVSSKSGSTLETRVHAETFKNAFEAAGLDPTRHLVFVTDPGSPLEQRRNEGYRVFLADPGVGGRFSVLTAFGIVPTVLAGADTERILEQAQSARDLLASDSDQNPALLLAAAVAGALPTRYALLLREEEQIRWGLSDWIEQLIAESTGKEGKGVLPIALPPHAPELDQVPENSLLVSLGSEFADAWGIGVVAPLGAQFLLWEVATAALGHLLQINPFDQPDVEAAKQAARTVFDSEAILGGEYDEHLAQSALIARVQEALPTGGYVALQAFVDRRSPQAESARQLRDLIASELKVPVALGWGPRYLHSTGQLHKGGPELGVYLQFVDTVCDELLIPGQRRGFAQLMQAQARGDREVLESRGRPVIAQRVSD